MECRICGTDLTRFDIEYHYSKNHLATPDHDDYVGAYRDACRMVEEYRAWKDAVVGALNPMRHGDDMTLWGADLGNPSNAVRSIEKLRAQRDALRSRRRDGGHD